MQPVKPDRTTFQNITVNLDIQAETEDNGTLTYQWYKASGADEKGNPVEGAVSKSFSPDTENPGENWYYCIVKNSVTNRWGKMVSAETRSDTVCINVIENPLPLEMVLVNGCTVTANNIRGAFKK